MRSTDYLKYIADVLTTEEIVVIPGFGGFITKYRSAAINAETGHFAPPTKYIAFNQQLDQSDNTFAKYLDEETEIDFAPRYYDEFVHELKSRLNSNDIILIPGVGRLYQDYENVVHFLPETRNLNNETYGLPGFQFFPRKRPAISPISVVADASVKGEISLRQRIATAASIIFLIGMLSWIGIQSMLDKQDIFASNDNAEFQDSSAENRTTELSIIDVLTDTPDIHVVEEENTPDNATMPERVPEVEPAPMYSNVIIVGAFGQISNVQKMKERIVALGYTPYVDKPNRLNRVGLEIKYSTEEELEQHLQIARSQVTSQAWLLK
ncbi:MAG: hypothetical protein KJP00_15995 [Bacteroidia bacterium]|nr:hypothetical protein [Bacteroidia bacterium]